MELSNINSEKKFSSLYLVEQINLFRKSENVKAKLLHKNFLTKIEDEFDEEINGLKIKPVDYKDKKGENRKMYSLNIKQSIQILLGESKIVRKRIIDVLEKQQAEIERLKSNTNDSIQMIERHTHRPIQVESAKGANAFAFINQKGKEDAISWNRKVSFHFTKMLPHELKNWAKNKKVPSKFRTSGKEVIRHFRPEKATGVSIADFFHSKGETDDVALKLGESAMPVVNMLMKYQSK